MDGRRENGDCQRSRKEVQIERGSMAALATGCDLVCLSLRNADPEVVNEDAQFDPFGLSTPFEGLGRIGVHSARCTECAARIGAGTAVRNS